MDLKHKDELQYLFSRIKRIVDDASETIRRYGKLVPGFTAEAIEQQASVTRRLCGQARAASTAIVGQATWAARNAAYAEASWASDPQNTPDVGCD